MSEASNTADVRQLVEAVRTAGELARQRMSETHSARETALTTSRQIIRLSANSIRAAHRNEFADASRLIAEARQMVEELKDVRAGHPEVFFGGFVEDSLKEYVEASATLAFTQGSPLPTMEELGIGAAAYMNGMAEAIGELRRFVLDILRRDDVSRCENLLGIMDEVYAVLVTLDFPDAVTRGLRRNTDVMRGVIERTRGDLTVALRQRSLEDQLARLADRLDSDAG